MAFDINKLIDQLSPQVRRAFMASIADIKSEAQLRVIERTIRSGNFDAVFRSLNIRPEFFAPLDEALRLTYTEGGQSALLAMISGGRDPNIGGRVVARFNARNPRAERWISNKSSNLITAIIEDQRVAVRQTLTQGLEAGRGPRSVALDLVGRTDRQAGRRVGGVIGLDEQSRTWLANARTELRDNPERFLGRKLRDKRFDATIRSAVRRGQPLSQADIDKLAARYSDRLLARRGTMVARTEMLGSMHAAQREGIEQLIDGEMVTRNQVNETWDASNDADTRDSHAFMEGQKRGDDGYFKTGAGYRMMYPGDRSLGAPPEEIINCRCRVVVDINWLGGL